VLVPIDRFLVVADTTDVATTPSDAFFDAMVIADQNENVEIGEPGTYFHITIACVVPSLMNVSLLRFYFIGNHRHTSHS
jgi:hypothetical protein